MICIKMILRPWWLTLWVFLCDFQPLQLCPTEPTRSFISPGSALPEISFSGALQQTQYQCILKASQQWLSRTLEVKNHWPEREKGTYVVREGEEGFLILPASIFF